MPFSTTDSLIAVEADLAADFHCFTTSKTFDSDLRTPAEMAGRRLLELIDFRASAVAFPGQVHGNRVLAVESPAGPVEIESSCDGLVCAERGVLLAVRTADCLPVVLVDETRRICGIAHAGWRGTLGNIMAGVIDGMLMLGASAPAIRGWIGPSITFANYEVGEDLIARFLESFGHLGRFTDGRYLDLAKLNRLQAGAAGVSPNAIAGTPYCTFRDRHLFHSHRRQGAHRGHQFTVCGFV